MAATQHAQSARLRLPFTCRLPDIGLQSPVPQAAELCGRLAAKGAAITPRDDGAIVVTGMDTATIGDLAGRLYACLVRLARCRSGE